MKEEDYPALYCSASDLSMRSQSAFYKALFWHMALLVLASVISVVNSQDPIAALFQAVVLSFALATAVYLFVMRPDRYWYVGRAVAESIKTLTWRYMMKAEPFQGSDEIARSKLAGKLKAVVEQNRQVAQRLTTHLDGLQVTQVMTHMRSVDVDTRREEYIKLRIVDQQQWYAKKARFNQRKVKIYFCALLLTNFLAIAFAFTKALDPTASYWPTDILVTLAAGLLGWIQAKRYQELSASYALAAHEISLIREQAALSMTEKDLSKFVGDAENAFSREHTQWVARRDE